MQKKVKKNAKKFGQFKNLLYLCIRFRSKMGSAQEQWFTTGFPNNFNFWGERSVIRSVIRVQRTKSREY